MNSSVLHAYNGIAASLSKPTAYKLGSNTLSYAFETLRQLTVAVGISGGVDSAVAAMLLKQQGHDVFGIFMRNWDEAEEKNNQNCSVERDLKDATAVCNELNIPLHEVDFVSKYWNHVFTDFIQQYSRGLTPNPDLACNRYIKFDALLKHATGLGADKIATGHYARLLPTAADKQEDGRFNLYKGVDTEKDQTYFLASIQPDVLSSVLFPLGSYLKKDVRELAHNAGLVTADKRSSAGICFIGRRNFADFLEDYVDVVPGTFVNVDSGETLGDCPNITAVTVGQRPGIGGAAHRTYIVGKDVLKKVVFVGSGPDHPALFTSSVLLRTPHWLSSKHAEELSQQGSLRCEYRARYRQKPQRCTLRKLSSAPVDGVSQQFQPSAYCVLYEQDSVIQSDYLIAEFDEPSKAITPQQAFVMYDGDLCIGSCTIALPGLSLAEEGKLDH